MPFTVGGDWIPQPEQNKKSHQALPLKIYVEKRRGAYVTIIKHVNENKITLKDLAKELKKACSCGGTVKDNQIELQGDQTERVKVYLTTIGLIKSKQR